VGTLEKPHEFLVLLEGQPALLVPAARSRNAVPVGPSWKPGKDVWCSGTQGWDIPHWHCSESRPEGMATSLVPCSGRVHETAHNRSLRSY